MQNLAEIRLCSKFPDGNTLNLPPYFISRVITVHENCREHPISRTLTGVSATEAEGEKITDERWNPSCDTQATAETSERLRLALRNAHSMNHLFNQTSPALLFVNPGPRLSRLAVIADRCHLDFEQIRPLSCVFIERP